ncbi:MAG TPA: glycosyltransferase family 39 protein [Pyrinomonadaceae bacterium]|nr:glycosyltransferase family 39 protein [Pyrinomonadaceae bacterium]
MMTIKVIPTFRVRLLIGLVIFLLAFGVRLLTWHDTRLEVGKVQSAVVADYQRVAELLRAGGVSSFLSSSSPLADLNNLGHPPGYSFLIASVYSLKHSVTAVQFAQITADSLSAVLIFLIVAELLPFSAGVIAGLLAAFSPQLAWNSVLLLPDSISVLPILLAIYLLARALQKPRILNLLIIGALIGLSCWLRANAMLLTIFFAVSVPLLVRSESQNASRMLANRRQDAGAPFKWRFALTVVGGTLLIILPLTIRNAIVFHRFIPLSLGAGQTVLEGIADYDKESKFGIPNTDMGIMKQEAELYQRPDYYGTLFNPDGVQRERARLSRGFAIIRAHPFWFAGVMAKRASSMVRLERSRLISTEPAITHRIDDLDHAEIASLITSRELFSNGVALPGAAAAYPGGYMGVMPEAKVSLTGNSERYGPQFLGPKITVKSGTDYVITVPIKIITGRMRVSVTNASENVYSSQIIEPFEHTPMEEWAKRYPLKYKELMDFESDQPEQLVMLPFVAVRDENIRVVWSNEASDTQTSLEIGFIKLHELGPARFLWTRYPRFIIHAIQKIFITAIILPLAIIGLLLVVFRKQSAALVILSIVPVYFFCVQSAVHTEYRYVLAVDYFLFAFVGVALSCVGSFVIKKIIPSPSGRGLG